MMNILDGKTVATKILNKLKREITKLPSSPQLAVIFVGTNPASVAYIHHKIKACEKVGITVQQLTFPETISEQELITVIRKVNASKQIHGLIVQLPLPKHIDTNNIIFALDHRKDVDGFHPFNVGNMVVGLPSLAPCTPLGIIRLLEYYDIPLTGKTITVIGKSNIVGKPMMSMLLNRKATVTICDTYTKHLTDHTKNADIIISATGVPHLIKGNMIKKGAILIDVGFAYKKGKLYGDIDPKSVQSKAKYLSPVPGGVGPMTIALLLENTVEAYKLQQKHVA